MWKKKSLHVSADEAVVGRQRRIIKTPVIQVVLCGVNVPVRTEIQTLWRHLNPYCHLLCQRSQMPVWVLQQPTPDCVCTVSCPFEEVGLFVCFTSRERKPRIFKLTHLYEPFLNRCVVGHLLPVSLGFIIAKHGRFASSWTDRRSKRN